MPYDLILDPVGYVPAADVRWVLGALLLAAQHLRRTWGGIAVDGEYLGVFGAEAGKRVGVTLLDGASESLEV